MSGSVGMGMGSPAGHPGGGSAMMASGSHFASPPLSMNLGMSNGNMLAGAGSAMTGMNMKNNMNIGNIGVPMMGSSSGMPMQQQPMRQQPMQQQPMQQQPMRQQPMQQQPMQQQPMQQQPMQQPSSLDQLSWK